MEHSNTRAADLVGAIAVLERQKQADMAAAMDKPRTRPDVIGEIASWRFTRRVALALLFVAALVLASCGKSVQGRPDRHTWPPSSQGVAVSATGLPTAITPLPALPWCGPVLPEVSRDC